MKGYKAGIVLLLGGLLVAGGITGNVNINKKKKFDEQLLAATAPTLPAFTYDKYAKWYFGGSSESNIAYADSNVAGTGFLSPVISETSMTYEDAAWEIQMFDSSPDRLIEGIHAHEKQIIQEISLPTYMFWDVNNADRSKFRLDDTTEYSYWGEQYWLGDLTIQHALVNTSLTKFQRTAYENVVVGNSCVEQQIDIPEGVDTIQDYSPMDKDYITSESKYTSTSYQLGAIRIEDESADYYSTSSNQWVNYKVAYLLADRCVTASSPEIVKKFQSGVSNWKDGLDEQDYKMVRAETPEWAFYESQSGVVELNFLGFHPTPIGGTDPVVQWHAQGSVIRI